MSVSGKNVESEFIEAEQIQDKVEEDLEECESLVEDLKERWGDEDPFIVKLEVILGELEQNFADEKNKAGSLYSKYKGASNNSSRGNKEELEEIAENLSRFEDLVELLKNRLQEELAEKPGPEAKLIKRILDDEIEALEGLERMIMLEKDIRNQISSSYGI